MSVETLTLNELKRLPLEDVLERVLKEHLQLRIELSKERAVTISPEHALEPLPVLEGSMPNGWRDAIYEQPGVDSV